MDIAFDPPTVEEIVRHEMERRPAGEPLRGEYRLRLDETYGLQGFPRARAAQAVHLEFFRRLGWEGFFVEALRVLLPRVAATGVIRADRDEGCYVDSQRRLQVRLRRSRFEDRAALARWMRHEVVHASDMLDPDFGYREEDVGEPTRKRYGALWCASIEERLKGTGAESVTHDGLMQRARVLARPRCPICEFPSVNWGTPSGELVSFLRSEFPGWDPGKGLCDRCVEWAQVRFSGRCV
jgi:hypothetical protein